MNGSFAGSEKYNLKKSLSGHKMLNYNFIYYFNKVEQLAVFCIEFDINEMTNIPKTWPLFC